MEAFRIPLKLSAANISTSTTDTTSSHAPNVPVRLNLLITRTTAGAYIQKSILHDRPIRMHLSQVIRAIILPGADATLIHAVIVPLLMPPEIPLAPVHLVAVPEPAAAIAVLARDAAVASARARGIARRDTQAAREGPVADADGAREGRGGDDAVAEEDVAAVPADGVGAGPAVPPVAFGGVGPVVGGGRDAGPLTGAGGDGGVALGSWDDVGGMCVGDRDVDDFEGGAVAPFLDGHGSIELGESFNVNIGGRCNRDDVLFVAAISVR